MSSPQSDPPLDEPGTYTLTHRAYLQHLLSAQTTTYTLSKPILAAILSARFPTRPTTPEDITQTDFEDYISTLSSALSPFDYEIRSSFDQVTRERIFALVNTTSDAMTQMATLRGPEEMAFIKRVLDGMFGEGENNCLRREVLGLTSMQALKLAKVPASQPGEGTQASQSGLTMTQAEKCLENLVAEGWFIRSPKGFYSLSQRALMELKTWLVQTYNDESPDQNSYNSDDESESHIAIKFCKACREIVTIGQRCPNLPCNARLHNRCTTNFFRAQGNGEICAVCGTEWRDPPPVGEQAMRGNNAPRSSAGGGGARRSTVVNGTVNGERRSSRMSIGAPEVEEEASDVGDDADDDDADE